MMELFVDSSSASQVATLAAHYLGFVKDQNVIIKQSDSDGRQVPSLRLPDGSIITQPVVIAQYLISQTRRDISDALYPARDQPELDRWLSLAAEKHFKCGDPNFLHLLNSHLASRSFLVAQHITVADLIIFASIHSWMFSSSSRERSTNQNITRWYNHVQHLPGIYQVESIPVPFIEIEVKDDSAAVVKVPQSDMAKQQQETQTAKKQKDTKGKQAESKKTENKPDKETKKEAKPEESKTAERPVADVTRLEIRVGQIVEVWNHPEADKLYCEKIDIGEPQPRQIASGLREHVAVEEFQGQKVLVLCNMKEKKLRGFGSHGMILCGKKEGADGKEKIELVKPPKEALIGERVSIEGLSGEADPVMNTKSGKDPFVAVQPDFRVDDNGIACYKDHKFITSAGSCCCATVRGGSIS